MSYFQLEAIGLLTQCLDTPYNNVYIEQKHCRKSSTLDMKPSTHFPSCSHLLSVHDSF